MLNSKATDKYSPLQMPCRFHTILYIWLALLNRVLVSLRFFQSAWTHSMSLRTVNLKQGPRFETNQGDFPISQCLTMWQHIKKRVKQYINVIYFFFKHSFKYFLNNIYHLISALWGRMNSALLVHQLQSLQNKFKV